MFFKTNSLGYNLALLISALFIFQSCKHSTDPAAQKESSTSTDRIVSLNGALTEVIAALGYEKALVGRDVTSNYPPYVRDSVTDLGHIRSVSIESILNLKPTLIVGDQNEIHPELMQKIEKSAIPSHFYNRQYTIQGTKNLVLSLSEILEPDEDKRAKKIIDRIDADLSKVIPLKPVPKVLFIYARGAGSLTVAGTDTSFENIIALAGGINAVNDFSGFKPLTTEALMTHDPDVLLLFDTGLESLGGKEGLLKIPGIAQTKAGKSKAIITMEGGFLTAFGPRVGQAAYNLNLLLHPYAK